MDVSVKELVVVKVVGLFFVCVQVLDVGLVSDNTSASDAGQRVQVRVHGGDKQPWVVVPSGHDILGAIEPPDSDLEWLSFDLLSKLHDPADVVGVACEF